MSENSITDSREGGKGFIDWAKGLVDWTECKEKNFYQPRGH